jgi:hypothetical protein
MDIVIPLTELKQKESLISHYLRLCKELLVEPARFYRELASRYSVSEALCVGLVSLWLTRAFTFIVGTVNQLVLAKMLNSWLDGVSMGDDSDLTQASGRGLLFDAGLVLAKPFFALIGMALSSLVLFGFAKLFIADEADPNAKSKSVHYNDILKIFAFASIACWFSIVPVFGDILAYFAVLFIALIGLREVYQVSTKRAALVVFVPQFMFFMMAMLMIGSIVLIMLMLPWDQLLDADAIGGDEVEALARFFLR